MILLIRLNLSIFTVWKKLKNSVVKCEKTFSLVESLKALVTLNYVEASYDIYRRKCLKMVWMDILNIQIKQNIN